MEIGNNLKIAKKLVTFGKIGKKYVKIGKKLKNVKICEKLIFFFFNVENLKISKIVGNELEVLGDDHVMSGESETMVN